MPNLNLTPDQISNIIGYVFVVVQLYCILSLANEAVQAEIKKLGRKKFAECVVIRTLIFTVTAHLFLTNPDFYDRVSFVTRLAFMLTEGIKPTREQFAHQFDLKWMLAPLFDSAHPQRLKRWEKIMGRVLSIVSHGQCKLLFIEKRANLAFAQIGLEYIGSNPFSMGEKHLLIKVFPSKFVC